MNQAEFEKSFGMTPEEYAKQLGMKMRGLLAQRESLTEALRLEHVVANLREELNRHFRQVVSEGIVKSWVATVGSDGTCKLQVTSVKEFAEMFRNQGFAVEEAL